MIIEKISDTSIIEVDELDSTQRGEGGFGSTGIAEQPRKQFENELFNKETVYNQQVNLEDDLEWKEWAVLVLYSLYKSNRITCDERKQWLKLVFAGQRMIHDILREYIQKENLDSLSAACGELKITN